MLKNVTIGKKITLGLSSVLIILAMVALIGFWAIQTALNGFTSYREMARDNNLSGRLQANMLMVRMNVKDYLITGSDKDLKQYSEYFEKMEVFIEEAQREINNPQRAAKIDETDESHIEYELGFKKVVGLMNKRNNLVTTVLNVKGPLMENTLTDIMLSANEDNDMSAAFNTGLSLKHLLLARLYMAKFLDENNQDAVNRVHEEFGKMQKYLVVLDSELQNPERRKMLATVRKAKKTYSETFDMLVQIIYDRNAIITKTLDRIGPVIAKNVEDVKLSIKAVQDKLGPELISKINMINTLILIVGVISIVITALLSFWLTRSIIGPIKKLISVLDVYGTGDTSVRADTNNKDEIGYLAEKFNTMFEKINRSGQILKTSELKYRQLFNKLQESIRNKEYSFRFTPDSKKDDLSISLNNMLETLSKAENETNNNNWLKTGQADLSRTVSGERDITELCRVAITFIAEYVGAQVGTFFIKNSEEGEKEEYSLIANYAFRKRKGLANRFKPGEGLAGQAALEKAKILFTEIPRDYIKIESSLGSTTPTNIFVLPLVYENDVKGVIEIGSVKPYTELELDFIELAGNILSVELNTVMFNSRLAELLAHTKKQSMELREQQEELQASNEELEEKTEVLEAQKSEIEDKINRS
jgi:CHASE3 domain sensor protein